MLKDQEMIQILTNVYRGKSLESFHNSISLVIDSKEKKLFSTNDEQKYIYPRSSIKIFQAIPFAESLAIEKYNLNQRQVALACSSHCGQIFHIRELKDWIKKTNIKINHLKCGVHNPLDKESSNKLLIQGNKPNQLHNNCSGKHLAMLTSTKIQNTNMEKYLNFNHPHQIKIREIIEKFSESKIYKKNYGTDGCSAPQYNLKILNICKALLNLVRSYDSNFYNTQSTKTLINSILENPNYIGGTNNLDTNLIKISDKKIFCKGGAEGVLLFAHLEKKIVGVIKVKDGNERALPSVVQYIFKKLKILNKKQLIKYQNWYSGSLYNHAKIKVGKITTTIKT
tara:strand:- start:27944 stop:28960 length:1017 start_codon:yes stop_codon:yes gene_type:complete